MNLLERMIRLREAKRAIRKERFREALDILSHPPLSKFGDAVALRDRVLAQLMKSAGDALARHDLAVARNALMIARQAGYDGGPSAELMARLTAAERDQGMTNDARDDALSAVRRDLAAGSLAGARDKLDALASDDHREVDQMRRWLDARARDLDRYLDRARRALAAEDDSGAREALERAEALFPSHPEVQEMRAEVEAKDRELLKAEIVRATAAESPGPLWALYRDAVRRCPTLGADPEMARIRTKLERDALRAIRDSLAHGRPEVAQELLRAMHEHAEEDTRALLGGVQLWLRARDRLAAGEAGSAAELLRAARERVGSPRAIKQELQAAEAALGRRETALSRIEEALEAGDDKRATECIDAAIEAGDPAPWLPALRREVNSRLDAGAAALVEVTQMLREGRIHEARLGLIPLLGRRQTHAASLDLWREVTAREEAAARGLGQAEAVALDPGAGKAELADALRAVEEAMHHRTDQPQAEQIRERITHRHAAWSRFEEARAFADASRYAAAIERCRSGLDSDPGHGGLRRLLREAAAEHGVELLRRTEAHLACGEADEARQRLEEARDLTSLDPELGARINRLAARCPKPEGDHASRATPLARPVRVRRDDHDLTRFMLRVEEGPEALVLTEDTVQLGNARNPENHVAVMANISSNHAVIRRDISFHGGISYVLRVREGRECEVNGESVREAVLANGDEICLGRDVILRFLLPDPGSATALIEIVRGYHVDEIRKVLLMKGPGKDGRIRISGDNGAHLSPRRTDRTVWLYLEQGPGQQRPSLTVESDGELQVDGETHDRRAAITMGAYICCGPCRFQVGRVK